MMKSFYKKIDALKRFLESLDGKLSIINDFISARTMERCDIEKKLRDTNQSLSMDEDKVCNKQYVGSVLSVSIRYRNHLLNQSKELTQKLSALDMEMNALRREQHRLVVKKLSVEKLIERADQEKIKSSEKAELEQMIEWACRPN